MFRNRDLTLKFTGLDYSTRVLFVKVAFVTTGRTVTRFDSNQGDAPMAVPDYSFVPPQNGKSPCDDQAFGYGCQPE